METEEGRRARLENDAATKRLRLAMEMDKERKATLEKMVAMYYTAQVGPEDGRRKKSKKRNGFDLDDLDLIWIEIGVFKNKRNELAHPVMGTIFLVGYINGR